jgi:hypothetical protein
VGSDDESVEELRKRILPLLLPDQPWDLDADPILTAKAIEVCGRDWLQERQKRASDIALSLERELTAYAAELALGFDAVEGEAIRPAPPERRDGTPTMMKGVQGIRGLLDPWLRFWLRRGAERTVWLIIHPDGLALSADPVAYMKDSLANRRPRGW